MRVWKRLIVCLTIAVCCVLFVPFARAAMPESENIQEMSETSPAAGVGEAETEQWNLLTTYQGNTQLRGEDLAAETAAVLREIDNSFDISDYHPYVYEHNDGSATIVFVRVVGGFETDYEYRIGLEGNEMISVLDTTKGLSEETEAKIRKISNRLGFLPQNGAEDEVAAAEQPKALSNALRLAREQMQSSPNKIVGEQKYIYFYDVEQDRPCINVFTEYTTSEFPKTGGGDVYIYYLDDYLRNRMLTRIGIIVVPCGVFLFFLLRHRRCAARRLRKHEG